jgi:quinol-cytochrome oxidoreductase complex cytochrome b subunit
LFNKLVRIDFIFAYITHRIITQDWIILWYMFTYFFTISNFKANYAWHKVVYCYLNKIGLSFLINWLDDSTNDMIL